MLHWQGGTWELWSVTPVGAGEFCNVTFAGSGLWQGGGMEFWSGSLVVDGDSWSVTFPGRGLGVLEW